MTEDTITMKKLKSLLYPHLQRMRYRRLIRLFNQAKQQPIQNNKILMLSTSKGVLGGNLLAVKKFLEDNARGYDIRVITALNMPSEKELAYALAVSAYVLVDDYEPMVYVLPFRPRQQLVQVWHALGAFKKFGYARETAEPNALTHKNYTAAICSAPELVGIYAKSFGIDESRVKPVGAPRTDVFFDHNYVNAARERLYEKAPALRGKKIALFAPTFRGNSVHDGYYPAEWFDAAALKEALGDEWALIIKRHPFIQNELKTADGVFDFSDEREINDILFITDVLITDYSSVIFENAIIGNAAVLYAPDLEAYTRDRGFYYAYESYACGETVKEKEALADAIKRARPDDERMQAFKERFVSLCDGHSTERFCNTILEDR